MAVNAVSRLEKTAAMGEWIGSGKLSCKMRIFAGMKKYGITEKDYLKAHRKARREEEIDRHDRPVRIGGVKPSKKR